MTTQCTRCNGTGEHDAVTEPVRGHNAGWVWPVRCNACMGEGTVNVPDVTATAPEIATRFPTLGITIATFWNPATSMVETWQFGDKKSYGVDELLASGYRGKEEWQHRRIVNNVNEKTAAV